MLNGVFRAEIVGEGTNRLIEATMSILLLPEVLDHIVDPLCDDSAAPMPCCHVPQPRIPRIQKFAGALFHEWILGEYCSVNSWEGGAAIPRARQYLEPFAPHWHRSRHSEHDENSLGISRRSAKSAARSSAGAHYHTGSRATLASPDPPNDTMSGALQLSDMPPELLGKIFGFLTPPDITGLKLVGSVAGTTIYESF